jgi:hypothetical protein
MLIKERCALEDGMARIAAAMLLRKIAKLTASRKGL